MSTLTVRYNHKISNVSTSLEAAQIGGDFYSFSAIWDTGASSSIITEKVVSKLNLLPIGETTIVGVTGSKKVNRYAVEFLLPNEFSVKLMVNSCSEILGSDVLIGMDVISLGDFAITANSKGSTFSFQIPHGKEIDFKKGKQTPPGCI